MSNSTRSRSLRGWRRNASLTGLIALVALSFPAAVWAATPPTVTSFAPTAGPVGTAVTITGSGFTGATVVSFGAGHASFKVVADTKITATVPASAATGRISVTTPGGTGMSSTSFTVQTGVGLSAASGTPTTTLTVAGAAFGAFEGVDVFFDTTDVALTTTNATGNFAGVKVQVPASAAPGAHTITALGRHSGLGGQATFTVTTPWTQFHYALNRKGSNPFENQLSTTNVSSIDEDWSFPTGGPITSSPAVVNGIVYFGSWDGNVYAVSAATGAKLWSFSTGVAVDSSPAVSGGVVYIGSENDSVYALNASTGAKIWSFATGGAVESSPAVSGGDVYVGSDDGNVYAIKASTGTKAWNFSCGSACTTPFYSSPAVAHGVVYAAQESNVTSSPGTLWALNASTGSELWFWTISGEGPTPSILSSPAVANGDVYIGGTDNHVYAINAQSGTQVWSFTGASGAIDSSPAVSGGSLYVGSSDGNVYALFGSSGGFDWSFPAGGPVTSSPAVANGVMYVGSDGTQDNLFAVNASPSFGTQLWAFSTGAGVDSSPAISDGQVFVGSNDGSLYAFDLIGGLAPTLSASWALAGTSTAVQGLTVNGVPRGALVTVSCSGQGCPFASKVLANQSVAGLAGLFSGAQLGAGTRIRIAIAAPHANAMVVMYVTRAHGNPMELRTPADLSP